MVVLGFTLAGLSDFIAHLPVCSAGSPSGTLLLSLSAGPMLDCFVWGCSGSSPTRSFGLHICCLLSGSLRVCWYLLVHPWSGCGYPGLTGSFLTTVWVKCLFSWSSPELGRASGSENRLLLRGDLFPQKPFFLQKANCTPDRRKLQGWLVLKSTLGFSPRAGIPTSKSLNRSQKCLRTF